MNSNWIIRFINIGGALQSCGAAMNGQLYKSLVNPGLPRLCPSLSSLFSSPERF